MSGPQQAMLMRDGAAYSGDPDAITILTALRSWWTFDENAGSATYADAHGSNDLTLNTGGSTTNTSTISSTTALHGRAAQMARTDNRCAYIPRANTALDLTNTSFSFGGWFRIDEDTDTAALIMGRVGNLSTNIQAALATNSVGAVHAFVSSNGNSLTTTGTFAKPASTTYALIVLVFDRTGNTIGIRMREVGGALSSSDVAFASALYTGSTDANFTIGENLYNDSTFNVYNRNAIHFVDECFFIDKALSADEFDYLYNSGAGKSYADVVTDAN